MIFPDSTILTDAECEAQRLYVVQSCQQNPESWVNNQFIPASSILGPLFCTASKMGMTDCNRSLYIGGAVAVGVLLLMVVLKK